MEGWRTSDSEANAARSEGVVVKASWMPREVVR